MSVHAAPRPVSISDLKAFKDRGERFAMLTAYDYLTAQILDAAGVPVLLVGDSLGMVVLGYESTIPVTVDEMLHHTRAVHRGARHALVVADMPFGSYQLSLSDGLRNAARFLQEGGANAVKVEGAGPVVDLTARLTAIGVPVMAHVGLTPQSMNQLGGYKVQGRDEASADRLVDDAVALEQAGAFAIVVEAVPAEVGRRITAAVAIPTIGIGAGPQTDAQVLVISDMLGLTAGRLPRFVKPYADLRGVITDAVKSYTAEVESGDFPGPEHVY
jgi:3-methyl-2-oxobutanoate hydroxymethyltransferase